jgi:hypothetical protein
VKIDTGRTALHLGLVKAIIHLYFGVFRDMKNTVLRLLNLRSSEVWLVRNLFLVQLFQGIGIAYLFTSANALFLTQYPVDELPKAFMLSAVILLAVNYVYGKIEHRVPVQRLIGLRAHLRRAIYSWITSSYLLGRIQIRCVPIDDLVPGHLPVVQHIILGTGCIDF